jgi:hypothetical protein
MLITSLAPGVGTAPGAHVSRTPHLSIGRLLSVSMTRPPNTEEPTDVQNLEKEEDDVDRNNKLHP